MKMNENEEIKEQTHDYYEEYKLRQIIFIFEDNAETIEVVCKDKDGKILRTDIFQPEFSNAHINLAFQDKGEKSEESLYEYVKTRKQ